MFCFSHPASIFCLSSSKGQQAAQGIVGRNAGRTRGSCQTDAFKGPAAVQHGLYEGGYAGIPCPVPDGMQSGT